MANEDYFTPYDIDISNLSPKELENYISRTLELPQAVGRLLTNFTTAEFISDKLGLEFNLNIDQKKEIARIIRNVILADIPIKDMPNVISERLPTDIGTAGKITNLITNNLFGSIIDEIQEFQNQKFKNKQESKPQKQFSQPQSLHEQNMGNVVDLRNKK